MKKRLRQSRKLRVHNIWRREAMRDAVRAFEQAVADGDAAGISTTMSEAQRAIDKAAKQGLIRANTASRRKARLAKMAKAAE
jgi:small subunit ribosomal protein S20